MQKEDNIITPVILCGGAGTRLWPLSRTHLPKQLLALVNEKSMLQNTLERLQGRFLQAPPVIICNQEYRFIVAEQLREAEIQSPCIFLEPVGRNTAPAVTIAAMHSAKDQDPLLLIMPADHMIADPDQFAEIVKKGMTLANQGYLVLFGVLPTRPEPGYGYIHQGDLIPDTNAYEVQRFVEKPSHDVA